MAKLSYEIHNYFTPEILDVLTKKKVHTTVEFLEYDVQTLTKITNITYREILDIKKHILNVFSSKTKFGDSYYNYLRENSRITPTNIHSFDALLDGGLSSGSLYELCGFSSCGKTQICLTIALNISLFLEENVVYIDTKRDFTSKRLQEMLETRKCDEDKIPEILNRIIVKQISNEYELISCLYELKTDVKSPLIIIDSLPAIFYHTGNQTISLTTMNYVVNIMKNIAVERNTSFLLTNILIKDDIIKPGLGSYWNSIPNSRILVEKKCDNFIRMTVYKSSTIECNKMCDVTISDCGVV